MLNWNIKSEDYETIIKIAGRCKGKSLDRMQICMNLVATHLNGCPLDLEKLFNFPESDFWHDIRGINKHLNRETGELMDFFLPRSAIGERQMEERRVKNGIDRNCEQ